MTIRRMRIGCWIPRATNAHNQTVRYLLLFRCNHGCTNAPQCYFIGVLPVYFIGYNRAAFISIHPDSPQLYSTIEIKCFIEGLELHFDIVLPALLIIFAYNLLNNNSVVVPCTRPGCSLTSNHTIDDCQTTISNIPPTSCNFPHPFEKSLPETVFTVLAFHSSMFVCLFLARQPPMSHGLLIHEVSRLHTMTHHSR